VATKTKAKAPAGERDLPLKLAMRRVFWGMNYATRVNLKLALPGQGRVAEELSDVDVVAFSTGADFSLRLLIADCKSSAKVSPAGRIFWLAGVRDFFGADRAYVVLQRGIPRGAREAAGRLGIDILGEDDRQILENVHGPHAPAAPFFELDGMARLHQLTSDLDNKLEPLLRFREHDFWALPEERRLQRLIVELRRAAPKLDATQKSHRLLVVDLLFLFALGLFGACRFVSSTSLADPRDALLAYLLGGPEQTRARRQQLQDLETAVRKLGEKVVPPEVFAALRVEPAYFDDLAETTARFLRRPRDAQRILRYLEWWAQAQVGLDGPPPTKLGAGYTDYTRKLASDLARTCFSAAGLKAEWMKIADDAGNGFSDVGAEISDRVDVTATPAASVPKGPDQQPDKPRPDRAAARVEEESAKREDDEGQLFS
jgi:hypothetical protein